MRYSLLTAALSAAVYASPLVERAMVTEYAYVTNVVTVTEGAAPAPTSEVSVAAVPSSSKSYWGNWNWGNYGKHSSKASTPKPKPVTTEAPKQYTTAKATPTTPTTTKAAAETTKASSGGKPSYSEIALLHHNIHRANHSAPDMVWDDALAATALKIAKSCVYAHNVDEDGGQFGQNIAAGAPADNISSIITDHFYNAEAPNFEPYYGQATPSDMSDAAFDSYGHMSQMVWKGSTHLGCATYDCSSQGLANTGSDVPPYFIVCNYKPAGNYLGEFDKNVARPLGKPLETWSYGL